MSVESRNLPDSNVGRLEALNSAGLKNTAMGAGSILTPATKTRLEAIQPLYQTRYDEVGFKTQAVNALSAEKEAARADLKMVISHFIQVFNFAVDRRVFPATNRAYYKLDVGKPMVPDMTNDSDLMLWANNIVTGETKRIADGGTPLAFPSLAEVTALRTLFNDVNTSHNTATQDLDTAQEKLTSLNPEADKVIKKVWDEVETYYNEETPESMRQNARLWGVVYQRVGGPKKIGGKVTNKDDGTALAGAKVRMKNGRGLATSDADGNFELSTTLMDQQEIDAELLGFDDYAEMITLVENENLVMEIKMKKSV